MRSMCVGVNVGEYVCGYGCPGVDEYVCGYGWVWMWVSMCVGMGGCG